MKYAYIILYNGNVSSLGFSTEEEAFEWLEKERGVKQIFGYQFEDGFEIKEIRIY